MKTRLIALILTLFISLNSMAQTPDTQGGFSFTVDGLNYEQINLNEVSLTGGSFANPFTIPSSVTFEDVTYTIIEISFGAFSDNAALTSVTIPATITEIDNNAFSNTGLTEVIVLGETPATINANSFGDRSTINLTVPGVALNAYLSNGWSGFASVNGTVSTFEVGNITYGISSFSANTVDVISSTITGSLNIPQTVTFNTTVYTVTSIFGDAFRENSLTSVTMPNTITSIGNAAFRDNQITSVTLSNALITIDSDAFRNNLITSVTLPNTLTTLGDRGFRNNQIASIDIPGSLTVLQSSIFRENNLATINLAEGIIRVEPFAFEDNNLTDITIPATVIRIESFGFSDNPLTNLTSLAITPPVIGDPNFIFGNFNSLGSIDLIVPDGTEAAYEAANWVGFNSVNGVVPNEVGNTFEFNGLLYTITALAPNEVEASGGTTIPTTLVIPAVASNEGIDFSVTGIGNSAFENKGITAVTFPSTLRTLGEVAFRFNALTEVTIPEGITAIPQRCFSNNDLTSVTFPASLETIGFRSFENNEFTSLTLPENVTSIAQFAFRNAPLNTINSLNTLPPSVVEGTNNDSFNNEINIDVTVPNGSESDYTTSPWGNFRSINGIVNFQVGTPFTENNFNYRVTSLSPNEVEITGGTNIPTSLTIEADVSSEGSDFSVVAIGNSAFQDKNITSLSIPDGVTSIGTRAFRLNQIETVVIPNSVTSLGNGAFELNNLSSVTISENLTSIEAHTFRNNQLTTVTIPANVNSLGDSCFRSNPLTEVIVSNTTPPTLGSNDPFLSIRGNIALTVPNTTELDYLLNGWVGFASINGEDPGVFNEFEVDNITYRITSLSPNQIEVTGGTNVPQDLILPNNVSFQEELYTVTSISNGVFDGLNITSVILPNNLVTIRGAAFKNNLITEVSLPESLTTIEAESFNNNQLTTLMIPNSVISIGQSAFSNNNIERVALSDNLTSLGASSFENNSLTTVTLPASSTNIGLKAFRQNPLKTVVSESLTPATIDTGNMANDSFGLNRDTVDLIIPTGTLQAYTDATWTGFKSVTEANKALVLKVYLQGASLNPNTGEENLMRDDLRVAGVLPTTSPYADAATATSTAFDATGNDAIVDWVFVELRDATDNTNIIESASALLQRDGDVVNTDGVSLFEFNAIPDDYFISVKHRNHLGVMIANAKRLSPVATVVDYTKTNNPITNGNNAQTDIGLPTNVLGLWAGNVNGDTTIRFSGGNAEPTDIKNAILSNPGNFFNSIFFNAQGYFNEDVNMNGAIKFSGENSESLFIKNNILNNPGNFFNSIFFTITAQIP